MDTAASTTVATDLQAAYNAADLESRRAAALRTTTMAAALEAATGAHGLEQLVALGMQPDDADRLVEPYRVHHDGGRLYVSCGGRALLGLRFIRPDNGRQANRRPA